MSTFQDTVPADWEPFAPLDDEDEPLDPDATYGDAPLELSVNPAGDFPIDGGDSDPLA